MKIYKSVNELFLILTLVKTLYNQFNTCCWTTILSLAVLITVVKISAS